MFMFTREANMMMVMIGTIPRARRGASISNGMSLGTHNEAMYHAPPGLTLHAMLAATMRFMPAYSIKVLISYHIITYYILII